MSRSTGNGSITIGSPVPGSEIKSDTRGALIFRLICFARLQLTQEGPGHRAPLEWATRSVFHKRGERCFQGDEVLRSYPPYITWPHRAEETNTKHFGWCRDMRV